MITQISALTRLLALSFEKLTYNIVVAWLKLKFFKRTTAFEKLGHKPNILSSLLKNFSRWAAVSADRRVGGFRFSGCLQFAIEQGRFA
jgi:hypothetical protein